MSKSISSVMAGIFLLFAGGICGWFASEMTRAPATAESESEDETGASLEEMQAAVTTTLAGRGDLLLTAAATGVVRAAPSALLTLSSRAGGRVVEIAAAPGQDLAAGDLILRLEAAPLEAAVAQAAALRDQAHSDLQAFDRGGKERRAAELKSADKGARAALELARSQLKKLEPLARDGLVAERSIAEARLAVGDDKRILALAEQALQNFVAEGAQAERAGLAAALAGAEAGLGESKALLDQIEIRASVAGTLLGLLVQPGDLLEAGAPAGSLLSGEDRIVAFAVAAGPAEKIRVGAEAIWSDERGTDRHGRVTRILATIVGPDEAVEVVVVPDMAGGAVPPGLLVRGEIEIGRLSQALLVPEAAIIRDGEEQAVVVVGIDSCAHKRPVKVLGRRGGLAAVTGEFEVGDPLILKGGYNLPDGAHVITTPAKSTSTEQNAGSGR